MTDNNIKEKGYSPELALKSLPPPEPLPNRAAYINARRKSLLRSPKRLFNYLKYLISRRRKISLNYLPIKLDIENVSRCNFKCTMCQVSKWEGGKRAEDLPISSFKEIIDEQYGLVEIKIQGMGEPTLQNEDYFEMIRYARSKDIWVRTVTNGSLLHLNDNYKKLIDSDPNEIQISIDAATKEVFQEIRVGSVFERVIENCKLINAYSREIGVRRTKMWVVVQRSNFHQLEDLVHFSKELGFSNVCFSLDLTGFGQSYWEDYSTKVNMRHDFSYDFGCKLVELGKSLNVRVGFWFLAEKYVLRDVDKMCPWAFERAFISSDLRVVPCCIVANPDVAELGAAISFTKTWNSPEYKKFRSSHLDGDVPEYCKGCYK